MNRDEALAWVAAVFEEPAGSLRPETPRDEIGGWDSLGVLTLMADLDEKFDIRVTEKEMSAMTRVQDILDLLHRQGKLAA
jgi:acyl carrier protein